MFALVDGNVSEMRMRIPREIFLLLWDWFDQTTESWEEIAARTNFGSSSTEGCAIHSTYSTLKNAFHSYLHWIVQRKWKQLRKVWFLLVSFLSFDWGYRNLITSQFREVILTDNSRIHENIQIRAGLESPKYWKLRNYLTWMLEGGREGDGVSSLTKFPQCALSHVGWFFTGPALNVLSIEKSSIKMEKMEKISIKRVKAKVCQLWSFNFNFLELRFCHLQLLWRNE